MSHCRCQGWMAAEFVWFHTVYIVSVQGEQGDDGKQEGPPGPPGLMVSPIWLVLISAAPLQNWSEYMCVDVCIFYFIFLCYQGLPGDRGERGESGDPGYKVSTLNYRKLCSCFDEML